MKGLWISFLALFIFPVRDSKKGFPKHQFFNIFQDRILFDPMLLYYIDYFGCPALQYWSLHVPHVPTRILEEVNLAKAAARDPHLDHCEGHLFVFSFYVFRLLMIPYYFSAHHLMVVQYQLT